MYTSEESLSKFYCRHFLQMVRIDIYTFKFDFFKDRLYNSLYNLTEIYHVTMMRNKDQIMNETRWFHLVVMKSKIYHLFLSRRIASPHPD